MMRRALLIAACALACGRAGAASIPQVNAKALGLSACTIVAVETLQDVDSATAQAGEFFKFRTVNAVTNGTHVAIPTHTLGYGIVTLAQSASAHGRAGSLLLDPLYLRLRNGAKLGVVLDHKLTDLSAAGSSENAPAYLGAIPVPGMGVAIGAFNYFHHGKDITVKAGTEFAVFPSNDPDSTRCQRSARQ